ncbi:FAD dependent oxidoreductase [Dactylonectria estremocensis]|uniref:FAD dependent oxidoreductase n=1 Tax=Dactylonectria estremocensis TaxID=1079267 RepID=A0A9P9EUJ3_9HYPO|nr:FAD dependent oxidoreductase [Dactylonectria estremocensis]
MVNITILGAGITGLAIASQLPTTYKITIIGKHLPGDPDDFDYASPWAGACWVGVPDSSPRDQKLQLDAYAGLWRIASEHPNSGLRISDVTEIMEYGSPDAVWFQSRIPGFRFLSPSELPAAATWGMTYKSIIISPPVFLKWLRAQLQERGIVFKHVSVQSLDELKGLGHDILVNATGASSKHMVGVADKSLVPVRLQSIVMEKKWDQGFIYRGRDGYYFNIFARPDGTCYLGGFKDVGADDRTIYDHQRQTILTRGHHVLPAVLPSDKPKDYKLLYDIATSYMFRPQDHGGARIEKELLNGQKIVHAYGQEAGGFTYSFGMARAVTELVAEYAYELPTSSHL